MSQLPLFSDDGENVLLLDNEFGRIVYTPGFVPEDVAREWFDELRASVPWNAQRRQMYGREVDVPRLLGHFRLDEGERVPDAIRSAAKKVCAATGVPFNSVGLNFYRNGQDSVAPHSDHLNEIVEGHPIALLSLGATRRLAIRGKQPPRLSLDCDLAAGSLLVMSYATQLHFDHGIPKTPHPVGERISLAFRVKPTGETSIYG